MRGVLLAVAAAWRPPRYVATLHGREKAGRIFQGKGPQRKNIHHAVMPHQQQISMWLAWTYGAPYNKNRDPEMHF
jgi:hypothetical protein